MTDESDNKFLELSINDQADFWVTSNISDFKRKSDLKLSRTKIITPKELKHRIEKAAVRQGVSINQLALYCFTKEMKNLILMKYSQNTGKVSLKI